MTFCRLLQVDKRPAWPPPPAKQITTDENLLIYWQKVYISLFSSAFTHVWYWTNQVDACFWLLLSHLRNMIGQGIYRRRIPRGDCGSVSRIGQWWVCQGWIAAIRHPAIFRSMYQMPESSCMLIRCMSSCQSSVRVIRCSVNNWHILLGKTVCPLFLDLCLTLAIWWCSLLCLLSHFVPIRCIISRMWIRLFLLPWWVPIHVILVRKSVAKS